MFSHYADFEVFVDGSSPMYVNPVCRAYSTKFSNYFHAVVLCLSCAAVLRALQLFEDQKFSKYHLIDSRLVPDDGSLVDSFSLKWADNKTDPMRRSVWRSELIFLQPPNSPKPLNSLPSALLYSENYLFCYYRIPKLSTSPSSFPKFLVPFDSHACPSFCN